MKSSGEYDLKEKGRYRVSANLTDVCCHDVFVITFEVVCSLDDLSFRVYQYLYFHVKAFMRYDFKYTYECLGVVK